MKIEKLKELSTDELRKTLKSTLAETVALRLQQSTGQLENSSQIKKNRRLAARIQTLLSSASLAQ